MNDAARVVILSLQRDPATFPGSGDVREDHRPSARVERGRGGVQAHFDAMRRALAHRGHDVVTITSLDAPWPAVLGSAALTRVARRVNPTLGGWFDRRWHSLALRWAARHATGGDDRPVLFYPQCSVSTAVALRLAGPRDRVTSVVHIFDDSEADEMAARGGCRPGDWLDRRIRAEERDALSGADALVFVSQVSHDSIVAARPELARLPRRVVPNFLADDWTDDGPGLEMASVRSDASRLVTVGSIDDRKNHAYAVEIVGHLRRSGRSVHLDIVGDGPRRDALERAIAGAGLEDAVTLHGPVDDLRPLLGGADLYLHTSTHEAFGIVLIEAMAMGLPLAAIPSGGIPTVFDDGVEGRYLCGHDAAADAAIVGDLLGDVEARRSMVAAGRDRVRQNFSADAVVPMLLSYMMGPT